MKTERAKRQEIQSQLDQLKGTITTILEQKRQSAKEGAEVAKKFAGIPISETEDGDLYLPEEQLQKMVQPYEEKIRNLEMVLQRSAAAKNSEGKAQKVISAIVGEDESHGPAYQKYQAARQWADSKVVEFQRENGIGGQMTPGQALDYVFSPELEKEFADAFPNVPLEEVVQAEESQRSFRKMLKSLAKTAAPLRETTERGDKFQKLLRKPSGLGSTANAKAGHVNVTEKVADFTPDDIFNLSDAHLEALHKALRDEEKTEGLYFK
jgi:hypothetical protein